MKLTHVGISNFRSIGEEPVMIDLTKKINVLVGANNCGKSNVLRALERLTSGRINEGHETRDRHKLKPETQPVARVRGTVPTATGNSTIEFRYDFTFGDNGINISSTDWDTLDFRDFQSIYIGIKNSGLHNWLQPDEIRAFAHGLSKELLRRDLSQAYPVVVTVPQFREITKASSYSIRGAGIVELLATWDRPTFGHHHDRNRLVKVRDLLRELLAAPHAELEVSHDKSGIIVTNNDLPLPLESYGTGIHELIILAIAVLAHDRTLVGIEEPEIHLHPLLQRRFFDFLRHETTNQYVIATHSPALIAPNTDVAVTHLWLENGVTKSRRVETTDHSLEALRDLGVRASDLLQSNSVIWVEGPSDRIYLKRWLELLHPGEFREGIDYSIMFYGGRLLAHVSMDGGVEADVGDADELVRLLRINQHSAILIDSDRRTGNAPLNETKIRVQTECTTSKTLCWITDGREIENYLPIEAIAAAYAELAGSKPAIQFRRFARIESSLKTALQKTWHRTSYYDHAKPQMARRIAPHISRESLDSVLVSWMEKVVRVIRHESG